MVREMPKVEGIALQTEDEITAIGCCMGASMTGMKAMTASSGPGLSLYSENIGMAIMSEIPMVIVDVQRATNSPTAGADTDVQFVRWGTSGGMPIIALAPTTVEECFLFTVHAFNISEKLRAPVFILSNKELALLRERVDLDGLNKPAIVNRKKIRKNAKKFKPYNFKMPEDIPLMADIGGRQVVRHTVTMHGKDGFITKDPDAIREMWEHISRKICDRRDELELVVYDAQKGAESLIISYGVTARSARDAVEMLRSKGKKVSHLIIHSLWPVPETAIINALNECKEVIVPEMNLGQYVREIERIAGVGKKLKITPVTKINTTLISPQEIIKGGGFK
jgi:2-oxoglutarate ferredoxin oxidoreductase subunit alpha